jgi:hypothetical protein
MLAQEKSKEIDLFDQTLQSTLKIVAVILFLICLSLIVLGLVEMVKGWMMMLSGESLSLDSTTSSVIITGLGFIVIGIAVLDLTKSLLDEEIAERKIKNVQERARDFLTRFLPVIVFAISAEVFVKLAQAGAMDLQSIFWDASMMGIAAGAMLVGLGIYIRMTAPECREVIPTLKSSLKGERDYRPLNP